MGSNLDKWDETMTNMMEMSDEARSKVLELSKSMCICANCPSYNGTGEKQLLFCVYGKSLVIKEEKGCSCGLCPVVGHIGLTHLYFCTRGSEKEQRGI
jgi:hypothetical protein